MGWLQEHLDGFVQPRLGYIPKKIDFFTPEELTVIKNIWRAAKVQAASRSMLLAGRDAFVFEILARREGFPTAFRPDISRAVVSLVPTGQYEHHFLLDTGFAGSIPRGLGIDNFGMASAMKATAGKYQIFPHLSHARALALKIEAMPKYWQSGQYRTILKEDGIYYRKETEIYQEFSEPQEFDRAAAVTIGIYTSSTPKFIEERRPIKVNQWQDFKPVTPKP